MKQVPRRFFVLLLFLLLMGGLFLFPRVGQAAIQLTFESPADGQTISGVSTVSGWAFSTDTEASVTVRLRIDGGAAPSDIPCCASRADVGNANPGFPQAATSGFGQVFNFNLLTQGEHTLTIEVEDMSGTSVTEEHTITTVKPGGFEFLGQLDLLFGDIAIDGDDEIVIEDAIARDSATEDSEQVAVRLAWQANLQALGIIASENTGEATATQTSDIASKSQKAGNIQPKAQIDQAATVQFPAVIRVDPSTGDRTIVSDANTPDNEGGTENPPGPNFVVPQGVAVEADGQLAVTDSGLTSVYRVDPTSGQRTILSGRSASAGRVFIRPNGIAAYPSELGLESLFVVADSGLKAVVGVNPDGRRFIISDAEIEDAVTLQSPFGIAVEADGKIVVTDVGLKAIVRVTRDTEDRVILSDATTGSGVNWITPLDIDVEESGDLLVVDAGLNAVVRVNRMSGNRTVVSGQNTGTGPAFSRARALAILEADEAEAGSRRQLAVLDEGLRAIFRVDPTNGNRTIISADGMGNGDEFRVPIDIAVEADGNLIVIDTAPLSTAFENPSGASMGGFGMVAGWRFSNAPSATITDLQLRIDGEPSFDLLCCFARGDVANSFPERPQALLSGFSTPINFNLLDSGSHTFDITIQDSTGASQTLTSGLDTVKLGDFEFIEEFDLSDARVGLANQVLFIDNLSVRGRGSAEPREINTSFVWQASCQCFVATSECGNGSHESNEECDGAAFPEGKQTCQDFDFSGGTLGCRNDCSINFSQCEGGPAVLVANSGDDTVSLVSAATYAEVNVIPVGRDPRSVVIKPASQVAYVTNSQSDSISVMGINTLMPELTVVTNTIENVGRIPVGLAFSPDGRKAYVVNGGENTVRVIDTATETVDDTLIGVGDQPQEIAINSVGTRAYVTNYGGGTVSVIDLVTNTELTKIIVGGNPNGIAVRPGDAEVYVVSPGNDTVSIIETSTNNVVRRLTRLEVDGSIGLIPQKVAFSPDGKQAFITNSLDFTVTIIDTETRDGRSTLFVGAESFNDVINEPNGIFISPDGLRLYVSLFGRNGQGRYLGVFSGSTNRIQAFTEVGDGPIGIAVGGS